MLVLFLISLLLAAAFGGSAAFLASGSEAAAPFLEEMQTSGLEPRSVWVAFAGTGAISGGIFDGFPCNIKGSPGKELNNNYTLTLRAGLPPCPWDIDGNQDVGFSDLLSILLNWGPCPGT